MSNSINNICVDEIYNLNNKQYIDENDNIEAKETNPSTNIIKQEKELLGKKVSRRKDNIRSKILNHFISFIISFLNNYVKKIYSYQKVIFTTIKYEDRININYETIKRIMNLTIHEFCQKKVSSKNKIFDENNNFESFQIIQEDLEKIHLVNMKLSEFYNKFYLCKDLEYLKQNYGIDLNKTNNFYCLLKQKNDNTSEKNLFYETGINLTDKFIKEKPKLRNNNKNEKKNEISNIIFKIENSKHNNINIAINKENNIKVEKNDFNLIKNNQINDVITKLKEDKNSNIHFNIENYNESDDFLFIDESFASKYDEFKTFF